MDDDKPLPSKLVKHVKHPITNGGQGLPGKWYVGNSYRITSQLLVGCAGHLRSATLMAFRQRHVAHTEALRGSLGNGGLCLIPLIRRSCSHQLQALGGGGENQKTQLSRYK